MIRLLDMVARGIRTTRGLEEALGIEPRTVQYYTQAADWLGLLESTADCQLTPLGLELVYADDRDAVYARAVWTTPFIVTMMAGRGDLRLPEASEIARAIAASEPELAPATVRRRASAVRSLIAPAIDNQTSPLHAEQLDLPFGQASPEERVPERLHTRREYSPDAYRYILGALLDYGELTLQHVRALLDAAGADEAPLGGYVEMALSRGDGLRLDERVVASREATLRRDLADTTASVMLSDPLYRAYLDAASEGGNHAAQSLKHRADQLDGRYRPWDQRLFGRALEPQQLQQDLGTIVLDRQLASFPVADGAVAEVKPLHAPFLQVFEQTAIPVALPPSLLQLKKGVDHVNRVLRDARRGDHVGLPGLAYRPVVYHGGLLHPGEGLPRSIPDGRSLRHRLLRHAPFPAMLTGLLLVHRRRPGWVTIREGRGAWSVQLAGRDLGDLLGVLDGFAFSRQWIVSRRPTRGLPARGLIDALEAVGIATVLGRKVVLGERFFAQLRNEAEEIELHAQLRPLADAVESWLAHLSR